MTPRRQVCLVEPQQPDRFVSIPGGPPPRTIEHLGVTYVRTQYRTQGGWVIYRRA